MDGEQGFNESPVNVCLKQGKRLKITSRLKKESMANGVVEFENEYTCVGDEQQNG